MVKSILSLIITLSIIIFGAFIESFYVKKSFKELNQIAIVCQHKADEQTLSSNDTNLLQNTFLRKRKLLHVFIPHTEIKEMELWISESVKCAKDLKYQDASLKLEVVIELTEQIPNNFKLTWQNIL
ncbi:MAG: DUF4363 family protein [Clostridia bacterium]|nr:DUF4363 family protein [Clostridia bacterium]